jgi:hypothetical protein
LELVQCPQQVKKILHQKNHVSNVQDHVLTEEHQVSDFANHVSKVKQHVQEDPFLEENIMF